MDIKGHDGVIYRGRIDGDKLPAVDLHRKHSTVSLAPPLPPLPRPRLDSHPGPAFPTHQTELPGNDPERSVLSPMFPNLEPAMPREESFT